MMTHPVSMQELSRALTAERINMASRRPGADRGGGDRARRHR